MKNSAATAFWWALSWELDCFASSVALGVFGAMSARGAIALWLAGLRKRTHLLYEMISKETQNRMSPVRTDSGEAGLGNEADCTVCMFDFTPSVPYICLRSALKHFRFPPSSFMHLYTSIFFFPMIFKFFPGERRVKHLFVIFLFCNNPIPNAAHESFILAIVVQIMVQK